MGVYVDVDRAVDVAAKAAVGVFLAEFDAGPSVLERPEDLVLVVANAGHDAQPRNRNSPHFAPVRPAPAQELSWNSPTRMSFTS